MATSITGKLNKPANIFQAGDSTGFGIRLGVKYRDPKTKEDDWCNYSAVIFAKSPGQIQFYTNALVEGSVVEVSCDQLKINTFDGQNGQVLSIDMLNARLGYVHTGQNTGQSQADHRGGFQGQTQAQAPIQQAPVQQGGFAPQQAPAKFEQQQRQQAAPVQQGGFVQQQAPVTDDAPPY